MLGAYVIHPAPSVLAINGWDRRKPSSLPSKPTYHHHHITVWPQRRQLLPSFLPHAILQPNNESSPPSSGTVRINKCFREFASRREADRFVELGRVTVNGTLAVSGQRVQPGDIITLDGKKVNWETLAAELATPSAVPLSNTRTSIPAHRGRSNHTISKNSNTPTTRNLGSLPDEDDGSEKLPLEDRFHYIKYWKPRGVVCTCDRSIRGNILDALYRPPQGVRLFTVGRLDKDSSGLIILTSDGRLPNASLRSREGHPKIYQVTADSPVPDEDCQQLASGVVITTVAQRDRGVAKELTAPTLPCRIKRDGEGGRRLLMELREGRNRQIRRMLDALGYDTEELHRISFMGIGLDGMWEGDWKALDDDEMRVLRKAVRAAEANMSVNAAAAVEAAAGMGEQDDDAEMQ